MSRWSQRRDGRGWEHLTFWIALGAVVCVLVATVALSTADVLQPSSLLPSGSHASASPSTTASPSATPTPTPTPTPSPTAPPTSASPTPIKPKLPTVQHLDQVMAARHLVRVPPTAWNPLSFSTASFNLLGASHTRGKHGRKGYATGESRLPAQVAMLSQRDVSVAGLQEFQYPQVQRLLASFGSVYDVYPGLSLGNWLADNSIIWRTADWQALEEQTVKVPYFHGRMTPMPYVLLRHKQTGRTVWFANFHNPANVAGNAAGFRARAVAIEAQLVHRLEQDGTPVILTGDMNDRAAFACPFAQSSGLRSANGASYDGGRCLTPAHMDVDWIFGSRQVTFADFDSDPTSQRRHLSDHPLVTATATLPGVQQRPGCVPRIARRVGAVWYCPA
jgi:hypothetical protein